MEGSCIDGVCGEVMSRDGKKVLYRGMMMRVSHSQDFSRENIFSKCVRMRIFCRGGIDRACGEVMGRGGIDRACGGVTGVWWQKGTF